MCVEKTFVSSPPKLFHYSLQYYLRKNSGCLDFVVFDASVFLKKNTAKNSNNNQCRNLESSKTLHIVVCTLQKLEFILMLSREIAVMQ